MRWFYGWNVVAAVFVMATVSFGLGFYSMTVYVAALQHLHGWSAAVVSAPITVYYLAGALVTLVIGDVYARFGPRRWWRSAAWPSRPASPRSAA